MILLIFLNLRLPASLVYVKTVLQNIINNTRWEKVQNTHSALKEESNFGGGYIVLNQLPNDVNIVAPLAQSIKSSVNFGSGTLDDERTVTTEDVIELNFVREIGELVRLGSLRQGNMVVFLSRKH